MVEQLGTVFLKPSEKGQVSQKIAESGIIYSIPETGEQYDPATGRFVQVAPAVTDPAQLVPSGRVDKFDRERSYYSIEETRRRELAAWERGRPARELAARIKAEAELEAARRETARREAEIEAARKSKLLSQYLMTTKQGVVDTRTGRVIAPVGTSVEEAVRRAEKKRIAKGKKQEFFLKTKEVYEKAEEKTSRAIEPVFSFYGSATEKLLGIDPLSKEASLKFAPSPLGILPPGFGHFLGTREFIGGAIYGAQEDIRKHPIKQVALYGVGRIGSLGVSGIVGTAGRISPVTGKITQIGITGAGIGLTGYYGYGVTQKVRAVEDPFEKGEIVGVSAKDTLLIGAGAKAGAKDYQKLSGLYSTRGRGLAPLKELTPADVYAGKKTFPTAPTKEHLRILQTGKAGKIIGEPAGAFHTTPTKFWKEILTPKKGTSELAGLYGSSYVSPHFAKVSGVDTSSKLFGWSSVGQKPAIAYLKPLSFRTASWTKTGKGYKWITPAKKGYADIPKMKTEIETIFRPEAGGYTFESGKYYTKIKDVRVPIDVFKYGEGVTGKGIKMGGVNLYGGKFYSYSGLPPTSLISPIEVSALGLGLTSYKKDYGLPSTKQLISSYTPDSYKSPTSIKPSRPSPKSTKKVSRGRGAKPSPPVSPSIEQFLPRITPTRRPTRKPSGYFAYTRRRIQPFIPTPRPFYKPIPKLKKREPQRIQPTYGVQVRRFGKFRPIAKGVTFAQAVEIGRGRVGRTLAATFKLTPEYGKAARGLRTPKGFYAKPTKRGVEFIERRRYRLSTRPETKEIQFYQVKRKRKRRG